MLLLIFVQLFDPGFSHSGPQEGSEHGSGSSTPHSTTPQVDKTHTSLNGTTVDEKESDQAKYFPRPQDDPDHGSPGSSDDCSEEHQLAGMDLQTHKLPAELPHSPSSLFRTSRGPRQGGRNHGGSK